MRFSKYFSLLISVGIFLTNCSGKNSASTTKAIIGEDNRSITVEGQYLNSVGFFMSPFGSCTGFLSSSNEVTTAAHCAPDLSKLEAYSFILTNDLGKAGISSVIKSEGDVITFKLNRSFENHLIASDVDLSKTAKLVSYDHEQEVLLKNECGLSKNSQSGLIQYKCDAVKGASGSPIVQDGKVVAIHIGFASPIKMNIAQLISEEQNMTSKQLTQISGLELEPEVDCGTNCKHKCRPSRYLPPEPTCYITCESAKATACTFERFMNSAKSQLANAIANDPNVQRESGGWSKISCAMLGGSLIGLTMQVYSAPICVACNIGAPACVGALAAAAPIITGIVCTQLCTDHHLSDCQ